MLQTVLAAGAWDKNNAEKYDSVYFFARDEYPSYGSAQDDKLFGVEHEKAITFHVDASVTTYCKKGLF